MPLSSIASPATLDARSLASLPSPLSSGQRARCANFLASTLMMGLAQVICYKCTSRWAKMALLKLTNFAAKQRALRV